MTEPLRFWAAVALLSPIVITAQSNVRAWNADGQVFVVWELAQQTAVTYSVHVSPGIVAAGFLGGTLQRTGDRGEVVIHFGLLPGLAHGWRWIKIGVAPEFSYMAHWSANGL